MLLTAFFSDKGVPATGLSPTIDVWEDDATLVVDAQAMAEIAGGWYKYDFAGYDESKDYVIVADGGAGLADNDRYCNTSNEIGQVIEDLTAVQADLDNPGQYKADVASLALEATAQLIKTEADKIPGIVTETDKIQSGIIDVPSNFMANVASLALEATVQLIKTETDKIQPDIIASSGDYKANIASLALEATSQLIKTEADKISGIVTEVAKIQSGIIDTPENFMANVASLALEATSQLIKTETDKIDDIKAKTDKLTFNLADRLLTDIREVNATAVASIDEFKADVTSGEYDGVIATIQADLDNPSQYKADVSALALEATVQLIKTETDKIAARALEATVQLIKTETDKIQPDIIASSGDYKANVTSLALEATAQLIKTETDKIQPDIIDVPGNYKANISALALEATSQLIKTETDKIQPSIIAVPENFMADVSALALEATVQLIKTEVDKIQPDIIDVPNTYKANVSNLDVAVSSRSSHNAAAIWAVGTRTLTSFGTLVASIWEYVTRTLTAGTRDTEINAIKAKTDRLNFNTDDKVLSDVREVNDTAVSDIDDFKADVSGLSPEEEYNARLNAIQADLDNPAQYKADVTALALEVSLQLIKTETDKIQSDIIDVPGDYKADITALALEATALLIKTKTDEIDWDDITFLKDIEGGKWRVAGNQMIFLKADNVTEVAKFDLFSEGGLPTMRDVFSRVRV